MKVLYNKPMVELRDKKIIFVFASLELGGAEKQALQLARYLTNEHHARTQFWGFSGPGKLSQLCDQYGIPWQFFPFPFTEKNWIHTLINLYRFCFAMRKAQPDILLPYTIMPNIICGLTWRWTGARACIWNQRDLGIGQFAPKLERIAIRNTPVFIANSDQGINYLNKILDIPMNQLQLIRNGVELDPPIFSRKEWRDKMAVEDNTFVACMVGNLSKFKDHITLLKAWRMVKEYLKNRHQPLPLLVLAGRFDDMYIPLRNLAGDLGIIDQVQFLGKVEDIAGLLQAIDLGLFSSFSESSPNGVLECMAAGLAVVATETPGVREVIGDEGRIQLSPVGNDSKLAENIIEFISSKPLRTNIGIQNRNRVLNEYGLMRMCEETAALLSETIKSKN
jgi:glycosyltransferase involved in cell wall biosynthesis